MDVVEKVLALVDEYNMIPPDSTVLCALSGGGDSICLTHTLLPLVRARGGTLVTAHYNHHLRGAESQRDADFVVNWCHSMGIDCILGNGDVAQVAHKIGRGIEETAREMRYKFLKEAAQKTGAQVIATAHNADDNLETLLLHLVRGSGLQGLTGIPPRRGTLVRPLLTTSRQEVENYLCQHALPFVADSTNDDTTYTRNRLRHTVIPHLREINPNLTATVTAAIPTLRSDNDYLNAMAIRVSAKATWAEDDLVIPATDIAAQPTAIATRAVRQLLEKLGDGPGNWVTRTHIMDIVALCKGDDPSAMVHLPGGLLVQRVYAQLLFTNRGFGATSFAPMALTGAGRTDIAGTDWEIICYKTICPQENTTHCSDIFYLSCDNIKSELQVRPRQTGDSITLPKRERKSLKKLFIDEKVPRHLRNLRPVLTCQSEVLAVAGLGPDEGALAQAGEPCWAITLRKKDCD